MSTIPIFEMPSELVALAVALADECETSIIEIACGDTDEWAAGANWFDVDRCHSTRAEEVCEAVDYLRRRGLIEEHPTNPSHVRLLYIGSPSEKLLNAHRDRLGRAAA